MSHGGFPRLRCAVLVRNHCSGTLDDRDYSWRTGGGVGGLLDDRADKGGSLLAVTSSLMRLQERERSVL